VTNQDSALQIHVISLSLLDGAESFLDLGGEPIRPRESLILAKRNPETRINAR
jgi:hypothetical protein